MKKLLVILVFSGMILSCVVIGNIPFAKALDSRVGQKASLLDPTRYGDAGDIIRGTFMISGDGFTHITKNENGDIVQHWFYSEVLSNFNRKEWIGKCKVFFVVDPKTNIIKDWGYDEGGNPQSCRHWS
jgi:hypothetical protein